MPKTPAELERKVDQLDNDVNEIYTMLDTVTRKQIEHDTRFDTIDTKLEAHDTQFASISSKLDILLGSERQV